MKKIILLSILCLMLSACGKSAEDNFLGKWEIKIDRENGETLIWEFSNDFSLRTIGGGNIDSIEWTLFEELSNDNSSLLLLLYEDGELEQIFNAEFLLDDKLLLINVDSRGHGSIILNRIKK